MAWAASDVSRPAGGNGSEQSDVPEETGQDQETEGNEKSTVVPEAESEPGEETENSVPQNSEMGLLCRMRLRSRKLRSSRLQMRKIVRQVKVPYQKKTGRQKLKGKQLEISGWSVNRRRNFPVSFCLSECLGKREWPLCEQHWRSYSGRSEKRCGCQ